jgi:hypothetical protein
MNQAPFQKNAEVDKPGIVGARWWHAALADKGAQMVRRDAIRNILIVGGVLAGLGTMLAFCGIAASSSSGSSSIPDDAQEQRKTALEMQKAHGWSFGAVGESLVFDGTTTTPFDRAALATLPSALQPARGDLLPYYVRTLFEASYATPTNLTTLAPEEQAGFQPLANVMQPIKTAAMDTAYARGKSLASIFAALNDSGGSASDAKAGVVVDLAGPEAIAFAAGAADVFDPVFLFDNWPHPRGVVRSHETLAAAAYYQPLFAKARTATTKKPPMFVVDRRRLSSYTDDATQFDNRYVAKLPVPGSSLKALGVDRLLYVVPTTADVVNESDDLNDDFVVYQKDGIEVRPIAGDAFVSTGSEAGTGLPPGGKPGNTSDQQLSDSGFTYYGGSPSSHHSFFLVHPWVTRPPRPATAKPPTTVAASYTPRTRTTPYSSGTGTTTTTTTRPRPTNFGTVPVLVAAGTGVVLGARYSRSGSWNRSGGGGWTG